MGEHRDLGSEVDLVVGYEPRADLGMEVVAGWFVPGDAFADDADDAFFIGFEAIYVF